MIYTGYILGGNKDIKDYYLEIYWLAASNLKRSFFPQKSLDGCFFETCLFSSYNHCIIVCAPKYGYIKSQEPDPKLPWLLYLLPKNKHLWSKT